MDIHFLTVAELKNVILGFRVVVKYLKSTSALLHCLLHKQGEFALVFTTYLNGCPKTVYYDSS